MKLKLPIRLVRPICIAAVLVGIVFIVKGSMLAGLCMFVGSFTLERSAYRCPLCGGRLTLRLPLVGAACCPHCHAKL